MLIILFSIISLFVKVVVLCILKLVNWIIAGYLQLLLLCWEFYGPSTLLKVISSAVTLFLGKPPSQFTSTLIVHILSPVTDNCPS